MKNQNALPVGAAVQKEIEQSPKRKVFEGVYVSLLPLNAARDAHDLFSVSHGTAEKERLWTYMSYGPFTDENKMQQWLKAQEEAVDPLFFTVLDKRVNKSVGMVSFLNIVPSMRRLELGHIWYSPLAQRTKINTEAIYLMLCHCFEPLKYRRVEWKCDSLNQRSREAAQRLGFEFEGIFKQHMIIKGRNRDTAWYAMMDRDWPAIRANMEMWLYESEAGTISLKELNSKLKRPARSTLTNE